MDYILVYKRRSPLDLHKHYRYYTPTSKINTFLTKILVILKTKREGTGCELIITIFLFEIFEEKNSRKNCASRSSKKETLRCD